MSSLPATAEVTAKERNAALERINAVGQEKADVEAIRAAGRGIAALGNGMMAIGHVDVDLLELLRDRLNDACALLWEIENNRPTREHPHGWSEITAVVGGALWELPILLIATLGVIEKPAGKAMPGNHSEDWYWCAGHASSLGKRMVTWADRQDGDEEVADA